MDAFRWILLAVGVAVVIAVYLLGRSRRRDNAMPPLRSSYDLPAVNVDEDGWVDGVGPVRVVQLRHEDDEEDVKPFSCDSESVEEDETGAPTEEQLSEQPPEPDSRSTRKVQEQEVTQPDLVSSTVTEAETQADSNEQVNEDAVVVIYVVAPRGSELKGEQILSATYATRLQYGEMNIFHRKDDEGNTEFSMANVKEPGWFDDTQMNSMTTRGVSLFTQLDMCKDPVRVLDDMLLCAYTMAGMLGGQICDQNRQLLNESFTQALRSKAKQFAKNKSTQSA